jgi:D-alanyl-lipoteichoic acid acyltransferase DltB (MBOAT superfamily)
VIAVVTPLLVLKYSNFFLGSVQAIVARMGGQIAVPHVHSVIPIGLSFYTFVVVGYLVDVHLERIDAEPKLERFALLTAFFPKFVAGPVERGGTFLPQLETPRRFDYARVTDGIRIIGWGFFKKVVVADRIAVIVDGVYQSPAGYHGLMLALVSILYMFQVYYDFSGYSDIAVGSAKVLGYDLVWNFNRPYAARSVSDYWRRWHISLTSWFFEYIFWPIAAALRSWRSAAVVVAMTTTFLVSGLWHGAQWTFVLFGLAHSIMMTIEFLTAKQRRRIRKWIPARAYALAAWATTFTFLLFADILFRARSVGEAGTLMRNMVNGIVPDVAFLAQSHFSGSALKALIAGMPVMKIELVLGVALVAIVELVSLLGKRRPLRSYLAEAPTPLRWAVYYAVSAAIIFLGAHNTTTAFLYAQF